MSDDNYRRELQDEVLRLHAQRDALERVQRQIEQDVEDLEYRIKVCSDTLRKVS